jgi:hypothetical protein
MFRTEVLYFHIPKDKRNKLEPSRKKGIFMGYSRIIESISQNNIRLKSAET